jgi:hypothetical protein
MVPRSRRVRWVVTLAGEQPTILPGMVEKILRAVVVRWCSTVGNRLGVMAGVGRNGLSESAGDIVARYGCGAVAVFAPGSRTRAHPDAKATLR